MTGSRPHLYWMLCWKYISPCAMLIILVASFYQLVVEGSSYPAWIAARGNTVNMEWPHWCIAIALILILSSILWIPFVAVLRYVSFSHCVMTWCGDCHTPSHSSLFSRCVRLFGIKVIEESEAAWFPEAELKDVHGIVPHDITELERTLLCFNVDGSEGLCWPIRQKKDKSLTHGDIHNERSDDDDDDD